ncbi:MAG: NADH-quinone oxidoreductase subunit NuoE [Clostridiales bacterium]|nr:NADH-quinone oxidoreductase subunit NuoE [Clostridiales bacterium]
MADKPAGLPFDGTPHQETELKAFIAAQKGERGALMPVIQKAQEIYGYLPREVQVLIAREMGVPLTDVYGVATFYAMFSLQKSGKHRVAICMGTACYVRGSQAVLDELIKQLGVQSGETTADGLFTLDATRCLGCCGLAPVIMVDDDVYGRLETKDIADILKKYRKQ